MAAPTDVEDFTGGQVKLIGLAETPGAIGLALPEAVDVAPVLGPVAGRRCRRGAFVSAATTGHGDRHGPLAPATTSLAPWAGR